MSGNEVIADGKGMRSNAGKNQLDLIPPEWIAGLGHVLTRGAYKYERRNFERGMRWGAVMASGLRHILAFVCGEKYDPETGCHHMAMAAWNMLTLMTYDIRKIGDNDLVGKQEWMDAVAIAPGPALQAKIDEAIRERSGP